jgi:hypothetical protein
MVTAALARAREEPEYAWSLVRIQPGLIKNPANRIIRFVEIGIPASGYYK